MMPNAPVAERIAAAARLLMAPAGVAEVRILHTPRAGVVAGYYNDPVRLAADVSRWDGIANIYLTPNPVKPALIARAQNRLQERALTTTGDTDILCRRWLPLDFDPARPSGISSTNVEHQAAIERAKSCREWLRAAGWPEPILADSGNGAHLLYRIDLPNNDDARLLVQRVLQAAAFQFSDEAVHVDLTTYNAARIWKLYGTTAVKGDNTPERPHRQARLLAGPDTLSVVPVELLERLAALLPQEPEPTTPQKAVAPFDLERWIAEHSLPVVSSGPWNGGKRWVLNPCPWNSAHTTKTAYIVQFANGAIAAGCRKASCAEKDWPALRDLYEPDWRAKQTRTGEARNGKAGATGQRENTAPALRIVCMAEVLRERIEWLWLDRIPLKKLTILDGDPGLGKSTLTLDLVARLTTGKSMPGCDVVTCEPASVVLISAEDGLGDTLRPRLEAAGADLSRIRAYDNTAALPSVPDDVAMIEGAILECRAKLVVIDPLMAFLSGDVKSHVDQEVRRALSPLAAVAQSTGAAIVLIRHLNKLAGGPAMYRGGGSIGISGACRSALLVGRVPDQPEMCALATVKTNLGPLPPSLAYKIVGSGDGSSRIEWEGVCQVTADQLVVRPGRNTSAAAGAAEFLEECLAEGPMVVPEIRNLAQQAGVAWRTLERAKRELNIASCRVGTGWGWRLPDDRGDDSDDGLPKTAKTAKTANINDLAVLSKNGHVRAGEEAPTGRDAAEVGGLDAKEARDLLTEYAELFNLARASKLLHLPPIPPAIHNPQAAVIYAAVQLEKIAGGGAEATELPRLARDLQQIMVAVCEAESEKEAEQ